MDAILADDASLEAATLASASGRTGATGFVVGQRRGPRFIAERLVPAGPGPFPVEDAVREADRLWDGRIIGFYAVGPAAGLRARLLRPAFCGKLVLLIGRAGRGRTAPAPRGFLVDFDGRFTLKPLPVSRG